MLIVSEYLWKLVNGSREQYYKKQIMEKGLAKEEVACNDRKQNILKWKRWSKYRRKRKTNW